MKSKFMLVNLIVIIILIIIGIILMLNMCTPTGRNVIDIDVEGDEVYDLKFENLCLIPGDSSEYKVILRSSEKAKYRMSFAFDELEEGNLKLFARVKMEMGDEVIYDELLSTAFEDGAVDFTVDLTKKKSDNVIITYYMPLEVGNEAKSAEASFELHVTATKE